jgi:Fur family ferric uptake transcriptional regulator
METNQFKALISGGGLKTTKQREEILNVFLNSPGHKNLTQLYFQVAKINPKIGYTTVYRTLKLLTRLGWQQNENLQTAKRDMNGPQGSHHDHLICLDCGKIIEFEDKVLETLQTTIAQRYRFKPFHHRLELYGLCSDCASKKGKKGENHKE